MTDENQNPTAEAAETSAPTTHQAEAEAKDQSASAGQDAYDAGISATLRAVFRRNRYHGYSGELRADALDRVKNLAIEGTAPSVVMIPTGGLGRGLPPQIPVLWDRAAQEPISLMDLIEEARPPLERTGTAVVETLDSFVDLVNRHKDEGSAIFARTSWPKPSLTSVIDYHTADGDARFCKHRIHYNFPITKEFARWIDKNETNFKQAEFADFLEEGIADLSIPTDTERTLFERRFRERFALPNELIDLARHLEIHVGSRVKNAARNKTGERQVVFETEHTGPNGEAIDIPGLFWIAVAPFISGAGLSDLVGIPARLRYRIVGGEVVWSYNLYQWEDILRDRIQRDLARAVKETGLPSFEGAPEIISI